ncbi:hypothetical protein OIU85_029687 [Salix viminalis]|uniref:Aconitase A/isopropylmalate dehydratase small subunit swivel domain-containing protein n=1 Tax=Salix viminalis TaxID=40686 RepID=A0A9Q0QBX9_SALVM|nr:hypothetical protein OIU85_029687 [Salix viminalis]
MAVCRSTTAISLSRNPNFSTTNPKPSLSFLSPPCLKLPSILPSFKPLTSQSPPDQRLSIPRATAADSATPTTTSTTFFHGHCYVVGDNIDTDQIIPAEYLTLVPSKPDEYEKLGSYALIGLPATYKTRFIEANQTKKRNTRSCSGVKILGAGLRVNTHPNSVATGEIYPLESEVRICEECKTGDLITIELMESKLINHTSGKEYKLKPIGDAGPVIEAGGIFAYARKTGMIPSQSTMIFLFGLGQCQKVVVLQKSNANFTRKRHNDHSHWLTHLLVVIFWEQCFYKIMTIHYGIQVMVAKKFANYLLRQGCVVLLRILWTCQERDATQLSDSQHQLPISGFLFIEG